VTFDRANLGNRQINAAVTGTWAPEGADLLARVTLPSLGALGPGYGGSVQAEARLEGTAEQGRIALDGSGRNITVSQPEADRLLRGDSTVRLRAGLKDGRLQIDEARLRTPQIDAGASGTVTDDLLRLQVDARLVNLGVLLSEFPGPLTVSGTVSDDGRGYDLNLTARGPGGIDARAAGRIDAGFGQAGLTIGGTAQAGLANAFLGDRAIDGQVGFDLRMNGPLALRSLSGPVRLSGGRLADPALPFSLTGLAGTATLGGGSVNLSMGADVTSGGRIEVSGTAGLASPYRGDLTVRLASLRLRDPQLYETMLQGSVTVTGPLTGGAVIGGTILLDETEVRVPSTGLGSAAGLPGLRHVNEPAPVRQTRVRAGLAGGGGGGGGRTSAGAGGDFALNLSVRALNRIFVRGRGLDAELGGGVDLNGTLGNIVASGGFELIRGRLDILGKRLTLDRANLGFQGDLMPALDIQASSRSDGVTASVVIAGRADAPEVSFASTPELPEDEVLAHLLFGQGLDNLSAFQALQLASAVATLAGRGGDGLVGKLRKGFGLDDLDVVSGDDGESTVRAGKYLAEGIYSQVEVESGGKSRVTLNLDLRRGLTARGSVGNDGEASLGLFLERDY
jgi:translocation and assembly module TamB